ncbi:unnamed protein product, partial [Coregonus sp. 'balchen']
MEYHWVLFSVLLQLTFQTGSSRPTITPSNPHLVIPLNAPFSLHCQGDQVMRWQREDRPKLRGEVRSNGASDLKIPKAQPVHMGRYICLEESSGEQSSVYVFVKVFSILTRAGDSASIPCLATDPGVVNLSLEPCHGGALPTGLHYVASLEQGMVIYDTKKAFEGCYICTGRLGGAHVKSHHYDLTVRPDAAPVIEMQEPKRVVLTRGQTLTLTCSTTNVNGDIKLKWAAPPGTDAVWASYPQQPAVENASRILTEPIKHVRSARLYINSVRARDSGRYRCEGQNEKGISSESIWLDVYDRGFINLTPSDNGTVRVRAGESLSLRVDMEAYPKPHTFTWSLSGQQLRNTSDHVITTQNHQHRYNSVLRLVRLKTSESGVYTFYASNGDATVNQSFSVYVISKPEIVSHEGPVDGQVRCVAKGYPAPQITWYYCEQPYMRCSHQMNATQEEQDIVTVTLLSPSFGKTEVESRLNITTGRFHTDSRNGYVDMRPSVTGVLPNGFSSEKRCSMGKAGKTSTLIFIDNCGSSSEPDVSEMLHEDCLSLDTEDLLSFSYQVAKGMDFLASKNIMRSCWEADPFKRPSFSKVVERIEQQLSDTTKHIYLNFSSKFPVTMVTQGASVDQGTQNANVLRLNSVGSSNASTQPLLASASDDVFLEEMATRLRVHRNGQGLLLGSSGGHLAEGERREDSGLSSRPGRWTDRWRGFVPVTAWAEPIVLASI